MQKQTILRDPLALKHHQFRVQLMHQIFAFNLLINSQNIRMLHSLAILQQQSSAPVLFFLYTDPVPHLTAAGPGEHVHQPRPRPAAGHSLCPAVCQTDAHVDFQHLSSAPAPGPLSAQCEDLTSVDESSAWFSRIAFVLPHLDQRKDLELRRFGVQTPAHFF